MTIWNPSPGGGTPGGNNGQLQYNNNGVFGGDVSTTDGLGNLTALSYTGLVNQNLLIWSSDLSNATWGNNVTTITYGQTAPDSSTTAIKLLFSTGSGFYSDVLSFVIGETFTLSVWLKGNVGGETVQLSTNDAGNTPEFVDLTLTNAWVRYSLTFVSGNSVRFIVYSLANSQTVYLWGPQYVQGSTEGNYVPTMGSPILQTPNFTGDGSGLTNLPPVAFTDISGTATTAQLPPNQTLRSISVGFDGGGSALTSGKIVYLAAIPYTGTITAVTMLADQSGSAVVDIWKTDYAGGPPTVSNTITASDLPTLSSAQKSTDSTLTGWTTSITAGDMMAFSLSSASTLTELSLVLLISAT